MIGALANLRTWDKRGHGPGRRERAHTQEEMECRERRPKGPCIIHVARVKQIPKCLAESNKHGGNGKCVKARKVMDLDGSGACT